MFNEDNDDSKYWSSTNNMVGGSALSYIPENVWNQSCANCGSNENIWAGGGGASRFFAKPTWQSGVPGIPNDGHRDLPDVSFTAAGEHDPYVICLDGSCRPNSQGEIELFLVGGTSASTPAFAGIMSLVDLNMTTAKDVATNRQGNPGPILYSLAAEASPRLGQCNGSSTASLPAKSCIFNDVTVGNNQVPGEKGYPNAPYNSGLGYDLASGLGSLNATSFVKNWVAHSLVPTTTTLQLSSVSTTHGQPVIVNVVVSPGKPGVQPTGTVSLLAANSHRESHENCASPTSPTRIQGIPLNRFTLIGGALSTTTSSLPGGMCEIWAHYPGDANTAPSDSNLVDVTVTPEASRTKLSICSYPTGQNDCPPFTGGPYGSFTYLRADVFSTTHACPPDCVPFGYILFLDHSVPVPGLGSYPLNSQGNTATPRGVFAFTPGSHSVVAEFTGNPGFGSSTSAATDFTITAAPTINTITYTATKKGATLKAAITTNSGGRRPIGKVIFSVNGNVGVGVPVAGTDAIVDPVTNQIITPAQATANYDDPRLVNGKTYNVTATYSGDENYKPSTSPNTAVTIQPDFAVVAAGSAVDVSAPGGSGSLGLTVTAEDGFDSSISFTCSGLPTGATCSFSPTSISGSGKVNVAIATTAASSSSASPMRLKSSPGIRVAFTAAASMLLGVVALGVPGSRQRRGSVLLLLLCAAMIATVSCGGGGGGGGTQTQNPPPPTSPTPTGSYNVTVTAASGSLSHAVKFTLNVL
ncbi:MAG TPA: Ig-like domain repeat protein [Terriglobales bacterium]